MGSFVLDLVRKIANVVAQTEVGNAYRLMRSKQAENDAAVKSWAARHQPGETKGVNATKGLF